MGSMGQWLRRGRRDVGSNLLKLTGPDDRHNATVESRRSRGVKTIEVEAVERSDYCCVAKVFDSTGFQTQAWA